MALSSAPETDVDDSARSSALMRAFFQLVRLRLGASLLGLRLFAGDIALGGSLVLLRLSLALALFVAAHAPGDFLDLALHAFDNAFDSGPRAGFLVRHDFSFVVSCVGKSIPSFARDQSRKTS